ncbi:MAG: protein kinase domain-containing protein [Thermoanaerobaculia bacterium]
MTLAAGTRLGPYEILSPLGAGGMGEVYKAKDTRLDRMVAIKVLPSHLSDNPELKARFEREARAISQLTHPHICALYDVGEATVIASRRDPLAADSAKQSDPAGVDRHGLSGLAMTGPVQYLVMELLEGQSLADRLEKGALPIEQTLKFGVEIADALDKAHRQGIVHRDLKPGNVMLTRSGVKLLDFGLAKLGVSSAAKEISQLSSLPTELSPSQPLTEQGTVMGTFQYMAPEQLEGKDADSRSDIFALGCVLYEMATGRKAFTGRSRASMIAAILEHEPAPISSIAPMAPPAFDRVVKTCLAKDPEDRWQSAHDVKSELDWIAEAGSQAGAPATVVSRRKNRERLAWILAAIASLAAGAALLGWYRIAAAPKPALRAVRLTIPRPAEAQFEDFDSLTPSPDGSSIAFVAHTSDGKQSLWLRPIDSLEAKPLPGTEDASNPFWSPDSRFLAFFAGGKLKKIDSRGGPPEDLCDAPNAWGGSWGSGGVILFEAHDLEGISKVSAAGGTPQKVTTLDPADEAHRWPVFLPDGDHFIFLVDAARTEGHWIGLSSLSSGNTTHLGHAVSNFAFSPTGHLLYVKAGSLVAQPFDGKRLRFSGDPVPVGENPLEIGENHRFDFGVSGNGLLVYRSADPNLQFAWLDRTGKRIASVGEPGRRGYFNLSPDERQVAFEKLDNDGRRANLWALDLSRGFTSRLTTDAASDSNAVWTPDGRSLIFTSSRKNFGDLYETPSAGGGQDRLLLDCPMGDFVWSISPDGRYVLYDVYTERSKVDLWLLPLSGDKTPRPFRATPSAESEAQFSPDGRYVAFVADDSGRDEIYVASFPNPSEQWRISGSGGSRPRWRGDGRELYFMSGGKLMSAAVSFLPAFHADEARALFPVKIWSDYAPTKDGQRFLFSTSSAAAGEPTAVAVLNWTVELTR